MRHFIMSASMIGLLLVPISASAKDYRYGAQSFCSPEDAATFINEELSPSQRKGVQVSTSYSPGCVVAVNPGYSAKAWAILNGQLTTVWYADEVGNAE